jgi:hypothetical protein
MNRRMTRLWMCVMCLGLVLVLSACGSSGSRESVVSPIPQDEAPPSDGNNDGSLPPSGNIPPDGNNDGSLPPGGDSGDGSLPPGEPVPFQWLKVSPRDLATDVPVNIEVSATFSAVPDPSSINPSTFIVNTFWDEKPVIGELGDSDGTETVTFKPTSLLAYETDFEIILTADIMDEEGSFLKEDYYGTFSTGKELKVIAFNPQGEGVPINSKIAVSFSKPVATIGSFLVEDSSGPVGGQVTYINNGTWVVFDREADLAPSNTYTVTLTDIEDMGGTILSPPHSWFFTTGTERDTDAPFVVSSVPERNAPNVDVNEKLQVVFSEVINPMTVDADSFIVENAAGVLVPGSFIIAGEVVTFVPSEPLAFKTVYVVTLTDAIEDLAGNQLVGDQWEFTTGFGVVSVTPAHLSRKVATNTHITAICSETLDSATVNSSTVWVAPLRGKNKGQKISGTVSLDGDTITFAPTKGLAGNNFYQVTLSTGIKDLSGSPLPKNHTWYFRTGK